MRARLLARCAAALRAWEGAGGASVFTGLLAVHLTGTELRASVHALLQRVPRAAAAGPPRAALLAVLHARLQLREPRGAGALLYARHQGAAWALILAVSIAVFKAKGLRLVAALLRQAKRQAGFLRQARTPEAVRVLARALLRAKESAELVHVLVAFMPVV